MRIKEFGELIKTQYHQREANRFSQSIEKKLAPKHKDRKKVQYALGLSTNQPGAPAAVENNSPTLRASETKESHPNEMSPLGEIPLFIFLMESYKN